jgi:hypothetical protein
MMSIVPDQLNLETHQSEFLFIGGLCKHGGTEFDNEVIKTINQTLKIIRRHPIDINPMV